MLECTECKCKIDGNAGIQFENKLFCNNLCRVVYAKRGPYNSTYTPSTDRRKTKFKKYKVLAIAIGVFVAMIAAVFSALSWNQTRKVNALKEIAQEFNRNTPRYIDNENVLTSASSENNILFFNLRFIPLRTVETDNRRTRDIIEIKHLSSICTNTETRNLLDNEVIIVLNFTNTSNNTAEQYPISSDLCVWRGYP